MAKDLVLFYNRLEEYRLKINPNIGTYDRHTYCNLLYLGKVEKRPGPHKFEVRGWLMDGEFKSLNISVVNWTMTAGPASLHLTHKNLHDWLIIEDNPATEVLYDK